MFVIIFIKLPRNFPAGLLRFPRSKYPPHPPTSSAAITDRKSSKKGGSVAQRFTGYAPRTKILARFLASPSVAPLVLLVPLERVSGGDSCPPFSRLLRPLPHMPTAPKCCPRSLALLLGAW